jgi:cephalosporin hydroxylase
LTGRAFTGVAAEKKMRSIADQFHEFYYDSWVWQHTYWMGLQTLKCPLDLWIYQEILFELRPQFIIECGTAAGRSALFLASKCDLLDQGRIVTVDIEADPNRPAHSRITYLQGSSTAESIVGEINKIVGDDSPVMVILDSDHSLSTYFRNCVFTAGWSQRAVILSSKTQTTTAIRSWSYTVLGRWKPSKPFSTRRMSLPPTASAKSFF